MRNRTIAYRPEIDGLRAIAILPVLFFHAGMETFSGGFVGVDVFFVISGYLIGGILLKEMEQGTFSVLSFYERRARRILPALFFVTLCCSPLAWTWMLPDELRQFGKSVLALGGFSSNIFFSNGIGYFTPIAEEQPLLHTWSLAVEEQYYLLFPLILMVSWRYGRSAVFGTVLLLSLASMVWCEWQWRHEPVTNYYLLSGRAWELLIGALVAFRVLNGVESPARVGRFSIEGSLAMFGLGLICLSIFIYDSYTPFPSLYTLVPVLGTVLVIRYASKGCVASKILASRPLVLIGLISYSAYLWHQPVFAFARLQAFVESSVVLGQVLVAVSLVLAYFTWKYVETPFRNSSLGARNTVFRYAAAALSGFVIIGAWFEYRPAVIEAGTLYEQFKHKEGAVSPNTGLFKKVCIREGYVFESAKCSTKPNAEILLWGDSFAMHLGQLFDGNERGVTQAAMSSCFPNASLTPYPNNKKYTINWARKCNQFSRSVLEFAVKSDSVRIVVISSTYIWALKYKAYDGETTRDATYRDMVSAVSRDVDALRAHGKKVVLVSPTPQAVEKDPLRCAKRALLATRIGEEGLTSKFDSCKFQGVFNRLDSELDVEGFLADVGKNARVNIVDLRRYLCDENGMCSPTIDNDPVYFDWGHLSPYGTRYIKKKFNIGEDIVHAAT